MAHRGARPKDTYIRVFESVVDGLESDIDQNLPIAQSLHDSQEMEQSPKEQISRLIAHECQHAAQLKVR